MIVIVNYGLGNLGSIENMLKKVGLRSIVSSNPEDLGSATKIILPGVGAFDTGMRNLRRLGLDAALGVRVLQDKVPVLGICLGAQLMTHSSEEGTEQGLGWFAATTKKMRFDGIPGKWPLPNIGWREVVDARDAVLLRGFGARPRFYFVHSYFLCPSSSSVISMRSAYGFEFVCGMSHENIHCVQFHPEKSHRFGMRLLSNFGEL
jgi:glutamine amidotransferase